MSDLISRRAAIESISKLFHPIGGSVLDEDDKKRYDEGVDDALQEIEELPSAQPEIIYCKDCKHFVRDDIEEQTPYGFYNTRFNAFCDKHFDIEQGEYIDVKLDDFCSFAERKNE